MLRLSDRRRSDGVRTAIFRPCFAAALLLVVSSICLAQTPQKIIDEYVRAEGGAKALAKVQSLTIAGSLREESTDTNGSYSLNTKAPNKFYSEIVIEPQHTIAAYNGMSAWGQDSTGAPHTLTGSEAVESEATSRYLNGHLASAKKDKLGEKFAGVENVRGRQAYHVELLLAPQVTRDVFFDTQTHLIVREIVPTTEPKPSPISTQANSEPSEAQTAGAAEEIDYLDYKPVNGILEPNRIELHRDGHVYQITVTRVEVNALVRDSIFDL